MKRYLLVLLLVLAACHAMASRRSVILYKLGPDDTSTALGSVTFIDDEYGLLIKPDLRGLPPGPHGFHIHQQPSCAEMGMAAGGHFDPQNTEKHLGPFDSKGHIGDLPILMVDQDGTATTPMLAPRVHVKDLIGHSIMIHAGSDNYSDTPKKLGGGGSRYACGVIAGYNKKDEKK